MKKIHKNAQVFFDNYEQGSDTNKEFHHVIQNEVVAMEWRFVMNEKV